MNSNIATKKDLSFGLNNEITTKNILETFFNCKLDKTENKYAKIDFINKLLKIFIELKSRRFGKNKYDTTFINYSKIEYSNKLLEQDKDSKIYFCFKYTDGIYYIQYNKDIFSNFSKSNTYLPARNCMIFNYHIPVNKLIKIA